MFFDTPGFDFFAFQQACAASDHLPEFGVGVNRFGKHQIDDFTNINTRVEHVHADGDARHVVVGELVEQAAFAVYPWIIGDQYFCQFTVILRVKMVKNFFNPVGVGFCGTKENGFDWQHAVVVFKCGVGGFAVPNSCLNLPVKS